MSVCSNCGWEGVSDISEIDDLLERVDAGEIMPHGQCPECGALVYDKCTLNLRAVTELTLEVGRTSFTITNAEEGFQVKVETPQIPVGYMNLNLTAEGLIIDGVDDNGEIAGTFSRMWGELDHNYLEGDEE